MNDGNDKCLFLNNHIYNLKVFRRIISLLVTISLLSGVRSQDISMAYAVPYLFSYDSLHQVDLADIARQVLVKNAKPRVDTSGLRDFSTHISAVPAVGYSQVTQYAVVLSCNIAFYTGRKENDNISSVLTSLTYSQLKQVILPIQSNIWWKGGKYNLQTDWRLLQYPSYTYGLGTQTQNLADTIDYSYFRMHQSLYRSIAKNLYAGLGFDLDYYWNIQQLSNPPARSDFSIYGFSKTEFASGVSVSLLFDSRKNSINPDQGSYLNISYRPKFTFLGSDANWQSMLIEYKVYKKFPSGTDNVFAFWSYNWLTWGGKPPYLMLPSTGWDAYVNTGRGYIQGRFRGSDMVYMEAEYRFNITSNGLFGGVIFGNAETFSSRASTMAGNASFNTFDPIEPGYGVGLRIKLNKFSRANLCIDYGWGTGGSRGVAVNLGEVF